MCVSGWSFPFTECSLKFTNPLVHLIFFSPTGNTATIFNTFKKQQHINRTRWKKLVFQLWSQRLIWAFFAPACYTSTSQSAQMAPAPGTSKHLNWKEEPLHTAQGTETIWNICEAFSSSLFNLGSLLFLSVMFLCMQNRGLSRCLSLSLSFLFF